MRDRAGVSVGWLERGWVRPPFPTYNLPLLLPPASLAPFAYTNLRLNPRIVSRLVLENSGNTYSSASKRRYHVRERTGVHSRHGIGGDDAVNFDFSDSANSYGTTTSSCRVHGDRRFAQEANVHAARFRIKIPTRNTAAALKYEREIGEQTYASQRKIK